MPDRTIGVFDSGVGGLTVLRELRQQIPEESLIYLGDTARVPYGTKSPETVRRYAGEAVRFMLAKRVKMIVVACNTASAHALQDLAANLPIPIVGVIEPGVQKALAVTTTGRIGVVGTEGTIRSGAYEKELKKSQKHINVYSVACPLFVPLAEEGWADHAIAEMAAKEYLAKLLDENIDTLVLGCTHYPLLKPVLQKVVGESVQLVDSAEETARLVRQQLTIDSLLQSRNDYANVDYFVTDISDRFVRVGSAFLSESLRGVRQVSLE